MFCTTRKSATVQRKDVPLEHRNLYGKTVVFTGGTDGMGLVAVQMMADMLKPKKLFVLGRNETKSRAVVDSINNTNSEGILKMAQYVHYDMAKLSSVREAANEILNATNDTGIDLLVNNAGANFDQRWTTEDGFECNWGVNHLAPFLLTHLLLDRLKASGGEARVVNVSSATEANGHIHLDDLQLEHTHQWTTFKGYAQAKLAVNMCTRKMAKELEGTKVTINAVNPGFIRTSLCKDLTGYKRIGQWLMDWGVAWPPQVGAERILTVAMAPQYDGVSGDLSMRTTSVRQTRKRWTRNLWRKCGNSVYVRLSGWTSQLKEVL